jgi:hypothetical protein
MQPSEDSLQTRRAIVTPPQPGIDVCQRSRRVAKAAKSPELFTLRPIASRRLGCPREGFHQEFTARSVLKARCGMVQDIETFLVEAGQASCR